MKPDVIFVDGVPMWNDDRGGVHNKTQNRYKLVAEYLPVPDIVVKQIPEPFIFGGVEHPAGDFVEMVDGLAVRVITAEEFAKTLKVKHSI
jgi:hypothetical protein